MKRLGKVLLLSVFLMTMVPFVGVAGAEECTGPAVTPTVVPGNPKLCGDNRIDPVPEGESTHEFTAYDANGDPYTATVTINVYNTAMGWKFNFVSDANVYLVVAKGGREGANVYNYAPAGTLADCGLYAPMNPSGKFAGLSHIDFCFGPGNGTDAKGVISGAKWYDLFPDGNWDKSAGSGEVPLPGWKIILYKWVDGAWAVEDWTLTDLSGSYTFDNLDPGTYKVDEGPVSGKWMQTWPLVEDYYAGLVITNAGEAYNDLDFGNVCVSDAMGYTMGFWGNKNGAAALKAAGYSAAEIKAIQSKFKSAANAADMCVMLEAQYLAHYLNTTVPVKGEVADYTGVTVIIGDEMYDYDDVMAAFADFDCATASRSEAEWYKDFFDGLNNNWFGLVYRTSCPVPVWN